MAEKPDPNLDAILAELLALRGDVCAKAGREVCSRSASSPTLAVFRLCRGLNLEGWRELTKGHDLKNWLTLPITGETLPHLSQIQLVLDSLSYETRHDPLTGLENRRSFERALDLEMERARRTEVPVSLALLDLDDFKAINDLHGHGAGDLVLAEMGRLLSGFVRRYDTAARIGGEEFALILSGVTQGKARMILEQLLAAVRGLRISLDGAELAVTCSIGLTSYRGKSDTPLTALVALADEALYRAKRSGKNRLAENPSPDLDHGARETLVLASEKQFLFKKG